MIGSRVYECELRIATCLFGGGPFTDGPLSHPAGLKQLAVNGIPVELQAPPIWRLLKAWRSVDPVSHSSSFCVFCPILVSSILVLYYAMDAGLIARIAFA